MHCLECGAERERLDNRHLLECSGLTLHEYAIRHHLPLELLLHPDQINLPDHVSDYAAALPCASEPARAALLAMRWAGLLRESGDFLDIPGEVRRLDLLLWLQQCLSDFGFGFRQDYVYENGGHRVVARNRLRVPAANLGRALHHRPAVEPPPAYLDTLAVMTAWVAERHGGYLFLPFAEAGAADELRQYLARTHSVAMQPLACEGPGALLRTHTLADAGALLALLKDRLQAMPEAWERLTDSTPRATVTKELVFDAAHFITDHPAKCSNLHGGRYLLQVQVEDRIDPHTGCVLDYGYLKRVVNQQVINGFDHHNLNYATPDLAWRSSTEMICVHVWERLIDYLPGLAGLRLYETSQSWCDYRGPSLEEFQCRGSDALLGHFQQQPRSSWRRALLDETPPLKAVGGSR